MEESTLRRDSRKPIYLLVTPFFPSPESWRGAYCYDFVQALRRLGQYDVRVFTPGEGEDYTYQDVKVCRFRTWQLPSAVFPLLFAKRNVKSFFSKLEACGIEPRDIAVCHGHTASFGVYPDALCRVNPRCLSVLHHHDLGSFGLRLGILRHFWPHKFINFFLLRRLHEAMDLHVFISNAAECSFRAFPKTNWSVYEDYRRLGNGMGWCRPAHVKQSTILWNGVDCSRFAAGPREEGETFTIGCIANFTALKDHLSLLRAVARLRNQLGNWCLRLIGSGPTLGLCQAFVREQNLAGNIVFEKEVDHTQLPDFYRSLDLFVLPSYFEGFGCVFTEAWACGTPFITCEGQGMDDMVLPEERHLWLCKPMNPEDLANKILFFYRNRPQQHLTGPIDIDVLVSRFVERVEAIRSGKNGK